MKRRRWRVERETGRTEKYEGGKLGGEEGCKTRKLTGRKGEGGTVSQDPAAPS